jgi:hypothetical protein
MNNATLTELSLMDPERYRREIDAMSFDPYATEATDDDLESMPDCVGCGQAIPPWQGARCRTCTYEKSLADAADQEQWVRQHQQMRDSHAVR